MKTKKQNYLKKIGFIALIGIILAQSNIYSSYSIDIHRVINRDLIVIEKTLVVVDHDPISIDGNAELATFIDDEGLSGDGTYNSPYIIENFLINGSSESGITIENTDAYLIIRNCVIESNNLSIFGGLGLEDSLNIVIKNNTVSNLTKGIWLWDATAITVAENNVFNNIVGVHLIRSSNNSILGNNIDSFDNTQFDAGIALYKSSFNNISDNEISNHKFGIPLDYNCYNNTLSKNNISYNNLWGIGLNYDCNNNSIIENNVNSNYAGIQLNNTSNNNKIFQNNVNYNKKHGINLWESSNNIIFGNYGSNNDECGIHLRRAHNTSIFENIIEHNGKYGISLEYSSDDNIIYFNDISENHESQAFEDKYCDDNKWDNATIGNYWGDYTDKYPDAGFNRFSWTTPYEIDGDGLGIDNIPLIKSILEYDPAKGIKISGFPLLNIIFFISIGIILLKRKIRR